jgi:hypothetical protein
LTSTHVFSAALARGLARLCLPLVATSAMATDAADAGAAVPLFKYQSVFTPSLASGIASGVASVVPTPKPEDWTRANATVGQFTQGHADILRAETSQNASPAAKPVAMPRRSPGEHVHPAQTIAPTKERP